MKSHRRYHLPMMNPPIQGVASPGIRLTSSLFRARLFKKIPLSPLSGLTLKSLTNLDQVVFRLLRSRFPRPQFEFITPEKLSQFLIQSAQCPLLISLRSERIRLLRLQLSLCLFPWLSQLQRLPSQTLGLRALLLSSRRLEASKKSPSPI